MLKLDKNTYVSLGTALTLFGAVFARDKWISDKIVRFEYFLQKSFTIEEMQIWTDSVREMNRDKYPEFKFPNPLDIRGKRKLRDVNRQIDDLLEERDDLLAKQKGGSVW